MEHRGVSVLMYADDMVLLADSKEGLQRSIDAAFEYSRRWRFLFNVGKDKTEIMIFHGQGASKKRKGEEVEGGWKLGGKMIGIVQKYVYLGVEIDGKGTFSGWKIGREKKHGRHGGGHGRWGLKDNG